jgi:hypothetical protein
MPLKWLVLAGIAGLLGGGQGGLCSATRSVSPSSFTGKGHFTAGGRGDAGKDF